MATYSIIRATQHMLRIAAEDDEGSNDIDITQAQLVTACADGPLQALFANPQAEPPPGAGIGANWSALNTDKRLSVHVTPGGASQSAGVGGYRFISGSPALFRLTVASGSVVCELRYNHTDVR